MAQEGTKNGLAKDKRIKDRINARPKWICAEDFDPKPKNVTGLPRVELARNKDNGTNFLVIYDCVNRTFTDRDTGEVYSPGALEIKIIELI